MDRIYLDNAATTRIAPEVLEAMLPYLSDFYGNPSSIHSDGRQSKAGLVTSRKKIAGFFNCAPNELVFTSGGTEADNMAITCAIRDLGVKHIVTTRAEHKAVLETSKAWGDAAGVRVSFLDLDKTGRIQTDQLKELLNGEKTLVSIMHGNNEIGTIQDIELIGNICHDHNAFFHSDTVQTMAHYRFDLSALPVDFATCSAHKFHGPKGCGFLYVRKDLPIGPVIIGGGQERNLRAGTENVAGVVGLAKALELAYEDLDTHRHHIWGLKKYMRDELKKHIPGVSFNGDCEESGLYTVLNVALPENEVGDMFLFSLDIQGVSASGGSACSSGSDKGSHVLEALGVDSSVTCVRFSFGRYNTKEEIDRAVAVVKSILTT